MRHLKHPFGEDACEYEVKLLGKQYKDYYFHHASFNKDVLDTCRYLLVGRRGSGKTSLLQYFAFQDLIPNAQAICIDTEHIPDLYSTIRKHVIDSTEPPEIKIPKISQLWEAVLWHAVFEHFRNEDSRIARACVLNDIHKTPLWYVTSILKAVTKKLLGNADDVLESLSDYISSEAFISARDQVLNYLANTPFFIAIDSLEHYSLRDIGMVQILAGLVQCASNINVDYAGRGLHVKVAVPDEIFPHLVESTIQNPSKHVRNPVRLYWRPKDLLRLVCWRYCKYTEKLGRPASVLCELDWNDHRAIRESIWDHAIGDRISNFHGELEDVFPLILRHTQLKPREFVWCCNEIAKAAQDDNSFLNIKHDHILQGIRAACMALSAQILNSYERIYPNASQIVDALVGIPMKFPGRLLDKLAYKTKASWEQGEYSPLLFRQVLCELGIIGRVRKHTGIGKYIEADFEYALEDRLVVDERMECVIHPMFYGKLHVDTREKWIVLPFPDRPSFMDDIER